MSKILKLLSLFLLAFLAQALPLLAHIGGPEENVLWTGTTGGSLADPANWTWPTIQYPYVPSAWDNGYITNGTTAFLTTDYPDTASGYDVRRMIVGALNVPQTGITYGSGALTIGSGGSLTAFGFVAVGGNWADSGTVAGTLTMRDGSVCGKYGWREQ